MRTTAHTDPAHATDVPHADDAGGPGQWTETSFGEFYEQNVKAVHIYLQRRTDRTTAEDLASEAFVRAWALRHRYDPTRGSPRQWLFGIVINELRNFRRSQNRRTRAIARLAVPAHRESAEDSAVHRLTSHSQTLKLDQLVAGLAERDRRLLALYREPEHSYRTIAEQMGLPEGTVRSRLHRLRQKLRQLHYSA